MKNLALCCLGLCLAFSVAADDTCEAAVDAADSMNVNKTDCDYSDKGLNGFLQKAFKKGGEGAVLETGLDKSANVKNATTTSAQTEKGTVAPKTFLLTAEVDQWPSVTLARAQLLPKAMEQCAKGFSIEREHYRSLAMGRISLTVEFICLE